MDVFDRHLCRAIAHRKPTHGSQDDDERFLQLSGLRPDIVRELRSVVAQTALLGMGHGSA
jgi:hypothetical protein